VKRLAMLLTALVAAAQAYGAVVVLTGGKRLEVATYSVTGSYVTVEYAKGRRESYPITAVDLDATAAANGAKQTAPAPNAEAGPHSPFLAAKSSGGSGALVVTDADVKHIDRGDEDAEGEKKPEADAGDTGSQVVLVSYDKRPAGKGQWDITATVSNVGKNAVQAVSAFVRVIDVQGKPLASGSGTMPGKLDAGKQGTITARVIMEGEPSQVAVDLSWQEVRPAPTPIAPKSQLKLPTDAFSPTPAAVQTNPMSLVSPSVIGAPAGTTPPPEPPPK